MLRWLFLLWVMVGGLGLVGGAAAQTEDVVLSNIHIVPGGELVLRYPADWDVMSATSNSVMLRRTWDETIALRFLDRSDITPVSWLQDQIDGMLEDQDYVVGELTPFILNGRMAVRAELNEVGNVYDKIDIVAMAQNGLNVMMYAASPVETRDEILDLTLAMLEQLQTPRNHPNGTISASDNAALPRRFTAEAGDLSFEFPADWYVYERITEDYQTIYVYGLSSDARYTEFRLSYTTDRTRSLPDYLGVGRGVSIFAEEQFESFTLKTYPALRYQLTDPMFSYIDSLRVGVDMGSTYAYLDVDAAALDDATVEPLMRSIIESITLPERPRSRNTRAERSWADRISAIELPRQFQSQDGRLSFNYPSNWRVREFDDGIVLFTDEGDAVDVGLLVDGMHPRDVMLDYLRFGEVDADASMTTQIVVDDTLTGYTMVNNGRGLRNMLFVVDRGPSVVYLHTESDAPDVELEATALAILVSSAVDLDETQGILAPSGNAKLPQTYTSAQGVLSFNLPAGWLVQEVPRFEGLSLLLTPATSLGELQPVELEYFANETRSIEAMATFEYTDVLYTDMVTAQFLSMGRKAVRVDMTNEDFDILRRAVYALDLGDGHIVVVSIGHTEQTQLNWDEIVRSVFDSMQVLDGSAPVTGTPSPSAVCTISATSGVNLRSGPGTEFGVVGALGSGTSIQADAQSTGSDGFVWWRLTNGFWVRSDVVTESEVCEALPTP
jgi:hypothetical protein